LQLPEQEIVEALAVAVVGYAHHAHPGLGRLLAGVGRVLGHVGTAPAGGSGAAMAGTRGFSATLGGRAKVLISLEVPRPKAGLPRVPSTARPLPQGQTC